MITATKRKERVTRTSHGWRAMDPEASSLRLVVKRDGGVSLLHVHEIDCLQADGNLVVVHAGADQYSIRIPLSQLLEKLTGFGFVRVHRSTVVRLSSIVGVEKGAYRKAYATLRSGLKLEIGRAEFNRLRPLWQPGLLDLSALSATLHLVPDESPAGA